MYFLKKVLRIIIIVFLLILAYFGFVIIYNTILDYKPKNNIQFLENYSLTKLDTLKIVTWNIGYAGLGEKMDFFYEGGSMVRPSKQYYDSTLSNIIYQLKEFEKHNDIVLLQEVDFDSKRSYFINQKKILSDNINQFSFSDSLINYSVAFVPFPILEPMGKVLAGLSTYSKIKPCMRAEIFFSSTYTWPKQIFFLDRGILIHGFAVKKNQWLFVINIHLSAFDDAKKARKDEINLLKKLIFKLAEKNHYIIVGGDWNINPPHFKISNLYNKNPIYYTEMNTYNFSNFYKFYYDTLFPTNRSVDKPYKETENYVSTLDYFLVSNNIEILKTETINLHFKHSDHNPVRIIAVLK